MDTHQALLAEIHIFVSETGMAETTFGRAAVGDASLVQRLRSGRSITIRKLDRIRGYMARTRAERAANAQTERGAA